MSLISTREKYAKNHMDNHTIILDTTTIEKEEINSIEMSIEHDQVNKTKEERVQRWLEESILAFQASIFENIHLINTRS